MCLSLSPLSTSIIDPFYRYLKLSKASKKYVQYWTQPRSKQKSLDWCKNNKMTQFCKPVTEN